jgi:hypothetical protein
LYVLLIFTEYKVRGGCTFCWYSRSIWWEVVVRFVDIHERTTTSHLILREYQQSVQPPLTLYFVNINKTYNHLSPLLIFTEYKVRGGCTFCWYSRSIRWEVVVRFVDIHGVLGKRGLYVLTYNPLLPYTPWISTKRTTTSYLILRENQQNVQPPLTLYSVNINKTYNHLLPYTPWISTKRTTTSYLILREYQQNVQPPLTLYSVNINKTYNHLSPYTVVVRFVDIHGV